AALPYIAVDVPAPATTSAPDATATTARENPSVDAAVNDAIAKAKEAAAESMKQNIPGGEVIGDAMQGPESEAVRANVELLRPHKELLFKTMTEAWLSM
ncbi:MAG TPA: hypothetical protein PK135_01280, partial [Arenimonas sp.]|nr:hypothetical protein [Arenimonas sp.]